MAFANTAEYVERVLQRVTAGKPQEQVGVYGWSIHASVDDALNRLAKRVAEADEFEKRASLQKSFSLTLASGEVAISDTMVTEGLAAGDFRLSGTTEALQYVHNIQDLLNPPPLSDFVFFTLWEGKIKVRTHLGAVPSATALTVICNYIPTITQVPTDLEGELVDIGVELAVESMNPGEVEKEAHEN